MHATLVPHLRPQARNAPRPKGPTPLGTEEMVRLSASLERLSARTKQELGELFFARLDSALSGKDSSAKDGKPLAGPSALVWAIGRVGARQPFFGSAHGVVDASVAAVWLERILALDGARIDSVSFAAMQLARATGDRARDLEPELRETVARQLEILRAPELWIRAVREGTPMEKSDEARIFGESLPAGLKLLER
jgi:hypothetical protein